MKTTTAVKLQTILAIDDDPNILQITEIILGKEGYPVEIAESGRRRLKHLGKKE